MAIIYLHFITSKIYLVSVILCIIVQLIPAGGLMIIRELLRIRAIEISVREVEVGCISYLVSTLRWDLKVLT